MSLQLDDVLPFDALVSKDIPVVIITSGSQYRRYTFQLVQDRWNVDVAGMQYEVNSVEDFCYLGRKRSCCFWDVRVG